MGQTSWNTTGNTAGATDFIGTINARDLVFKVNNDAKMVLDENWSLSVGQNNTMPAAGLAGRNFVTGGGNVLNETGGFTYNNLLADYNNSVSGLSSSATGQANTITHLGFGLNHALGTRVKIEDGSSCIGIGFALKMTNAYNRFVIGTGSISNSSVYLTNL